MRQPRKDIDNCIEYFLFEEKSDQSWSKIKGEVEDKFGFKKEGMKLHDEILNSSLLRLENNNSIDRHLCSARSDGRICYSLTMLRRQEIEMKLREHAAIYFLILFTELYKESPEYHIDDETIRHFLKWENIDLSPDKLIEIRKEEITTSYKPIQYLKVVKKEHTIIELRKRSKKRTKVIRFYYRIIGFSAKDIYDRIKVIRDRINKSGVLKEGKKTSIRDILNSHKIDEKSYPWFLVENEISYETISEAISILKKTNMIREIGIYNGELRYILEDDLLELLNYCLAIKEEILLMLEKWWKYDYPPDNETRKWLEFFNSPNEVRWRVEMYGSQRQRVSHNKIRKLREIRELKKETQLAENRYNDKIDYLESEFDKVIKKYECPLLTNFIQLTTNPSVLRNFRTHIKNKPARLAS